MPRDLLAELDGAPAPVDLLADIDGPVKQENPGIIANVAGAAKAGLSSVGDFFSGVAKQTYADIAPTKSVMDGFDTSSVPNKNLVAAPGLSPLSQAGYERLRDVAHANPVAAAAVGDNGVIRRGLNTAAKDSKKSSREMGRDAIGELVGERQDAENSRKRFTEDHPYIAGAASGTAGMISGIEDFAPLAADTVNQIIDPWVRLAGGNGFGNASRLPGAEYFEQVQKGYAPEITKKKLDDLKDGELSNWLAANAAVLAPQIAGSFGAALIPKVRALYLGTMGAMSSGGSHNESRQGGVEKSRAIASAWTDGAIEILSEMLPLHVFDKVQGVLRKLPLAQRAGLAGEIFQKTLAATGAFATQSGAEGIEEMVAQLGHNASKKYIAGNENTKLMEGVKEAGVLGAMMGAPTGAVHAGTVAKNSVEDSQAGFGRALNDAVGNAQFAPDGADAAAIQALDPNGTLAVNGTTLVPISVDRSAPTLTRAAQAAAQSGATPAQSTDADLLAQLQGGAIPANQVLGQVEPEVSGASDLIAQQEQQNAQQPTEPLPIQEMQQPIEQGGGLPPQAVQNGIAAGFDAVDQGGAQAQARAVGDVPVAPEAIQAAKESVNGETGQEIAKVAEDGGWFAGDIGAQGVPAAVDLPTVAGVDAVAGGSAPGGGANTPVGNADSGVNAVAATPPVAPSPPIIHKSGKPFKTKGDARLALDTQHKALKGTHHIVKMGDGFAIKPKPARTAKQQANDAKMAAKTKARKSVNTDLDSISMAVRKLGGINKSSDLAGEIRDLAFKSNFSGPVWRNDGKGIGPDQMARLLASHGYVDDGAVDGGVQELLDKLREDHFGNPQPSARVSDSAMESVAQAHYEAQQEAHDMAQDGFDALSEVEAQSVVEAIDTFDELDGIDLIDHAAPKKAYNNVKEELDDIFGPSAQGATATQTQGATEGDDAGRARSGATDNPAQAGEAPEFSLESQTEASRREHEQEIADAIAGREADQRKADAEAKRISDQKEIDSRMKGSVDNFQLGQSAEDSLAGQGDIFSKPASQQASKLADNPQAEAITKMADAMATMADAVKQLVNPVADAKPLYAHRPVTNAEEIIAWAESQGFTSTLPAKDMHVTIAYSTSPVDGKKVSGSAKTVSVAGGKRTVEPLGDGGAVVLKFSSDELQKRWQEYRDAGASWDYDGYTPHVTLTYKAEGINLSKVEPYTGRIDLGKEAQEPLNEDKADESAEQPTGNSTAQKPAQESETEEARYPTNPDQSAIDQANSDFDAALGDLGDILGKNAKANFTPEQEQKILPVLTRLFDAAFRKGYYTFKEAARFVLATIKAKFGAEVSDQITLDHLQGAYIGMAGRYKDQGADKARDVVAVESKEELGDIDNVTDQRSGSSVERNSGDANPENGVGEEGVRAGRDGNGGLGGQGIQDAEGEGGPRSGDGVSGHEAPAAGERGDLEIYAGSPPDEASIARDSLDRRSDSSGIEGAPIESDATSVADELAEGGFSLETAKIRQRQADKKPHVPGIANIRETLPILTEGQQDDVATAETRFAQPDGYGMLFTNGTGTGKTFTGLGIIKRFDSAGKSDIIIAVPNDKIADDWQKSGKLLGLNISRLTDTQSAGTGIVITTYSNFGQNPALARRDWDLIVHDEAHYLAMDKNGTPTLALAALKAISLHPDGAWDRARMKNPDLTAQIADVRARQEAKGEFDAALNAEFQRLWGEQDKNTKEAKAEIAAGQGESRPRVLFLSATPFAYEKTVSWANGYLFDYNEGRGNEGNEFRGYNTGSNSDQFMMQHFGYRMRTGKLTQPDAKVDGGLMQRQFNSWLKKRGVLSGRMLDVKADYDRRFVLVDSAIGQKIDEALQWFEVQRKAIRGPAAGSYTQDPRSKALYEVSDAIGKKFDYLSRRYLLEAIKAQEVIPHVREHLALGRKVVVFHDYKKGGGFNPFDIRDAREGEADSSAEFNAVAAEFRAEFKDLINSDVWRASSPITAFQQAFPGVLLFNGDISAKQRRANVEKFQDDASGPQVFLVQSAAGKEGISLHDTTGKYQRVLFNLGQPTQPTTAIQQEGRIYRTGQVTDAIFRYLNTGTNWEKWAFATTAAQRASAAENLGMGEQARALKDAFIAGFEESDDYRAGMENEGKGGKERDKAANNALTEYDRARAFYFGTQKKNSRTKSQEGADYFATPEPVGLKMMELADIRPGESMLEPSAGHGAIARWAPDTAEKTAIEPSMALRPRLAMVFDGKIIDSRFEDLNVVNKYDAIVMNPPFGSGGRTAIDHLAKAATHLREGGRIVALIPTGPAADAKFDKWFYEESERAAKPIYTHPELGQIYENDILTMSAFGSELKIGGPLSIDGSGSGPFFVRPKGEAKASAVNLTALKSIQPGHRTESFSPTKGFSLVADIALPSVTFERAGTAVNTRIVVIERSANSPQQTSRDYTDATDINDLFDRMESLSIQPRAKAVEAIPEAAPARSGRAEQNAQSRARDEVAQQNGQVAAEGETPTFEIVGNKLVTNAPAETVTKRNGKEIEGVFVPDGLMTKDQIKAVDEYTYEPKGRGEGWFVRLRHVDRPITKYSRNASTSTGLPIPTIQSIVDQAVAKYPRLAGVVHVVQSASELPDGGLYSDTEGAYLGATGEIYLVADNLPTERRARKVLAHEAVGHMAMEEMLNTVDPKLWGRLVNQIDTLEKTGNKLINSLAKTVDERYLVDDDKPGLSKEDRAKEVLALMAEDDIQNDPLFTGQARTVFQRFIDGIKAFMKLVFDVQMTDKDVLEIVKMAERHLGEKAGSSSVVAGMKGVMASRRGTKAGDFWRMLAGDMDLYQNPTPDSFDLAESAREIDPGMKVAKDKPDLDEAKDGMVKKWYVTMPDKTHAWVYENKKGEVWLNASDLGEGVSGGTKLYLLVGSYAEANGKVFIGDPAGLSDVALLRRTENMLSLALRYGGTHFMEPHEYQMNPDAKQGTVLDGVVRPITWVTGDDENNLSELLKTSYTNTINLAPEIKDVTYNFDKQRFEKSEQEFTSNDFSDIADAIHAAYEQSGLRGVLERARKVQNAHRAGGVGRVAGDAGQSGQTGQVDRAAKPAQAGNEDYAGTDGRVAGQPAHVQSGRIIGSATLKRAATTNTFSRAARGERGGHLLAQIGRVVPGGLSGTPLQSILYSRPPISQQSPLPGVNNQPPPSIPQQPSLGLTGGATGNNASWDAPEASKLDSFIYHIQNKHIDMKRVKDSIEKSFGAVVDKWNPYLKEELFHERAASRIKGFVESELTPMLETMAREKISQADLGKYLWARHAKEANAYIATINSNLPDGGSGMTDLESDDYMAALSPSVKQKLEGLARQIDAINHETRLTLVNYGLISPNDVTTWENTYKHYIPLNREDMDHLGHGNGMGQGFSIKGQETKRRTGSELAIAVGEVLGNIAMQRERAITRGEKNRVGLALFGMAKLHPNPDFWTTDKAPTIKVVQKINGQDQVVEMVDPLYKSKDNVVVVKIPNTRTGKVEEHAIVFDLRNERAVRMASAIKNLDGVQLGEVMSAAAKVTRYFASINTQYNPIFGVLNLTRDVQTAMLNLSNTPLAGKQLSILNDTRSILAGAMKHGMRDFDGQWKALSDEFHAEGGATGYRDVFATGKERAEALQKALDPDWWTKTAWGKKITLNGYIEFPMVMAMDKGLRPVLNWLSDYNETMENAVRLAAYKEAKGMGLSKEQAASIAKNLTVNFNRKGEKAMQVGAMYAFFNAAVQGMTRDGATLRGPAGKRIILGGVLVGAVQAMALAFAGFGDDEPPEFVKERNLVFPIGNGKYLTLPMPLTFNVLPNLGRIATELMLNGGKKVSDKAINMFGILLDASNPLGGSSPILQIALPTAVDPLAALAQNKDWTGKPIYREDFSGLHPTPGFTRSKDTSSTPSRWLAEAINTLGGGDKYTPGKVSPTPDQIDYLIGQVTGGVGRELSKGATTATALTTGEDLPAHKIPLLGRFYGDTTGQASQGGRFYENLKHLNKIKSGLEGRMKDRQTTEEFKRDNPEYRLIGEATGAERAVSELRREKHRLIGIGADKAKIKGMEAMITAAMKRLNDSVERSQKGPN